ncbi:MAG: Ig-like domain-containing protein [Proteobacteria bacterium]|nr:Ig-like domain-containing protein [Pseudomonadota bacterium]
MRSRLANSYLTLAALACVTTTVACSDGAPPQLNDLGDQVAQVGTELKIDLIGSDPDGDRLSYGYRAADLPDIKAHAQVTVSPSGAGVFRWTPLAADVGEHSFDFTASDGDNTTTVTIVIDVKTAFGSATTPIFRQPLGTGTTVDLSKVECVDINVVIEDQDSPAVTIAQEEPIIEGAMLQDGGDGLLSADDGNNPKTIKNYLVVLRGQGNGSNCPGAAPTIQHTASDQTTRLDLAVTANVADDKGLKEAPLLYYATTPPANPPNLAAKTQVSTTMTSGTNLAGAWQGTIPNPVATAAMGTSMTIYYLFVADDDDDVNGTCDHTTTSAVYQTKVTAGGSNVAGLCEPCTADAQCGAGNECVYIGNMGESYCLENCDAGCATAGFNCSTGLVYSVDGAQANQCVPQSGSCLAPTGMCLDDTYEENDTRSAASANGPLVVPAAPGNYIDAVSCPSTSSTFASDDDWYKLVFDVDTRVKLEVAGDGAADLDLHFYKSDATVISASTSLDYNEEINTCVKAGTYYTKVNAYGHVRSEYLLGVTKTPETCNTTCVDDSREMDDTYSQAQPGNFPTTTVTGSMICPNDDDFVKLRGSGGGPLLPGDVVTIDLTFTQSTTLQDLDLHMYRNTPEALTDLWPCSPTDVLSCSSAHGQGAVSNEHATFTVPTCVSTSCDYYLAVRGWNGATNSYGLTINIQ